MTMSGHEVVALLNAISAYDARTTGAGEIAAWSEAARRGRWSYGEALDAVHDHFAFDTKQTWLMPGTVTASIRRARIERLDREDPNLRDTPGDRKALPVGEDPSWGRRNSASLEAVHTETNVVACPDCGRGVGDRCMNPITGNATKIPHRRRLVAAAKHAKEAG